MEQELLEEMLRSLEEKQIEQQKSIENLKIMVKNEMRRINLDEFTRNIASISSDSVVLHNELSKIENDLSITNNNTSDNASEIKNQQATLDDLSNKLNKTNNDMTKLFSELDTRLDKLENKPEIVIPKLIPGDNVSIVNDKISVNIPTTNLDGVYSSLQKVYNDIDYLKNETNTPKQIISHWNDSNTSGQFVIPNGTFVGNIIIKNVIHKSKINATTKVIVNESIHNVRFGAGYADGTNFIWQSLDVIIPITIINKLDIIIEDNDYINKDNIQYTIEGINIQ